MTYMDQLKEAYDTVDKDAIEKFYQVLKLGYTAMFFGNGGSAAISNHAVTDFTKGIAESNSDHTFEAISLCCNVPLITAISNDIGYEYVFSRQMKYSDLQYATAIAISSSGNSKNIVEGLKYANSRHYTTVALVGFEGGEVIKQSLADVIIHVKSKNYGIVEDCHMAILHDMSQRYVRDINIIRDTY